VLTNYQNMSDFNRESTLHAQLKQLYAGPSGQVEIPIGSFICDCRTSYGELIEIQTGSFGPLKSKLHLIAQNHQIRIVHPIVRNRYIETYSADNVLLRNRRSPKKGSIWDVFKALIYAPELVLNRNIIVELVALDIVDKRLDDGKGSWRRKGISLEDKKMLSIHGTLPLQYPEEYRAFVPFSIDETFTIRDLYTYCKEVKLKQETITEPAFSRPELEPLDYGTAQKSVYVLHRIGLLERIGKRGNFYLYRKSI